MSRVRSLVNLLLVVLVLGVPARAAGQDVVSILPLRGVVEALAGPGVVEVLVGPGATPALYEPTARQMAQLSRARALYVVGVPFETAFVPRVRDRFPGLRIVDVCEGIDRIDLPGAAGSDELDHAHDVDPHVWTDPVLMLRVIDNVAAALVAMDPAQEAAIEARRQALHARWTALDAELAASLRDVEPRVIPVFHPAFGYFAARYGFRQVAVESGGTDTGSRHLTRLAREFRESGIDRLFVQPQFSPQRARALARALDVELIEIDPLDPDVEGMLRGLAAALGATSEGARR